MIDKPPSDSPPRPVVDDEIELSQLVRVLWAQRRVIIVAALVGALLGLGASLLSTRYVSDGLFLTPGVDVAAYKRYEAAMMNGARLQQFLQHSAAENTAAAERLEGLAEDPTALSEAIRPQFAFTDKDAKAFGVSADGLGSFVGIRLKNEQRDPTGGSPVLLLSEYVRDTIIRVDLEDTMLTECLKYQTVEQELRNQQLQSEFDISQNDARAKTLKDIIARTPGAASIDNRQIVSLEKGGERFLSPVAQLVGVEIVISDLKIAEAKRERDRVAAALKKDYYCSARSALAEPIGGRALLSALKSIETTTFGGKDMSADVVEQTFNDIDLERENWVNNYLFRMRFVAPPEGAETRVRKPGLKLGLVLGGIVGGMLGVFLAFLLAWWRDNRDAITSDTPQP